MPLLGGQTDMHRLSVAAAVLLALSSSPALSRAPEQTSEVYRVEEVGGGLGVFIDQEVSFSRTLEEASSTNTRWIAERSRQERNWCGKRSSFRHCEATSTRTHDWVDSAHCPQGDVALKRLAEIPLPTFRKLTTPEFTTVDDASLVTIEGVPEQGQSTAQRLLVAEYTGPFRAWWEATEKMLSTCWSPEPPKVNGMPVPAKLGAVNEAVAP